MKNRGITGSTLKIIAVIAMTMDHTGWLVIDRLLLNKGVSISDFYSPLFQISVSPVLCVLSPLFHTVGRITFPIMLFLLIEGVKYTRNKLRYIRNLAVFAVLSEVPFNLALEKTPLSAGSVINGLEGQNVFITLTFAVIVLSLTDKIYKTENVPSFLRYAGLVSPPVFCFAFSWFFVKKVMASFGYRESYAICAVLSVIVLSVYFILMRKTKRESLIKLNLALLATAAGAFITFLFDSDYAFFGVAAAEIMYLLKENKVRAYASGCAYLTAHTYIEAGTFLAVPLINAYNGKRGLRLKYFFYIFYPAHLLVLWGIRVLLKI